MTNPVAPIKAVSSQRSEEIEPKAGIANPNREGQFAPNYCTKKGSNIAVRPF
ncbi:hypothetical protein MCEGE10_02218 [Flavobacteriaceae bacterium]